MPTEQIQAVLDECADNTQEVEIQFVESQTKFGGQMYMRDYVTCIAPFENVLFPTRKGHFFNAKIAVHLTSIRIMRHESVLSVNEGGRRYVRPTD